MKVLSLFSGIGAFEKALDNLHISYELVGYCEIDKYASKSYAAIHGVDESMNFGDITKVDETTLPNDIDLITYGFPCQDISLAGKQKGLFNEDGTQTRSGLFFEALRLIEATKPKIAIAENVKNLVGKKFKEQFEIVLKSLEEAGYNNYWQVLNAKDYGIPQNRERVFIVSIRKDVDNGSFTIPTPIPLDLRLKDMLEDEVDEKYYITNEQMGKIVSWKAHQKPFERVNGNNSICPTLTARGAGEYHSGMITYSPENEDTTNMQLQVMEATKKGYTEAVEGDSINFEQPNSKTRRGRVGKQVAQTLTTSPQQGVVVNEK
jgi:DNA (cytosine-5)-methyltransferase 1